MAYLVKKCWTAPMPKGAEIVMIDGVRTARWRLRNGQPRSAEVIDGRDGKLRIRGRTKGFVARVRDANGTMIERPTGCRDQGAARSVMGQLERRIERVKSGLITPEEDCAAEHGRTPLATHIDGYIGHLKLKGGDGHRIAQVQARLMRVAGEAKINTLVDLAPAPIERWLSARKDEGMSASTRNGYREVIVGFANWCVRDGRLVSHRLQHLPRGDAKADRRHVRRALTEDELDRLLETARTRPLNDALLIRIGPRKGMLSEKVKPHIRARLEALGRERAVLYKVLLLTGLRKGELASIAVGQAVLDGPRPHLILEAPDEKNRNGSELPLRDDLAADLRGIVSEKLAALQVEARRRDQPVPSHLPPSMKLLTVPTGLCRIMDRDLVAAGIARMEVRGGRKVVVKTDSRGRTLDVHALRVSFGTHLSKAGVPLRTAQAAMRHSKPELTANVYTDPQLLDVAGAIESLPRLTLGTTDRRAPQRKVV